MRGTGSPTAGDGSYERIIARIDLDAIVGKKPLDSNDLVVRRAFFDYFLRCDEELYYRAFRRVSKSTWKSWWYGMRSLLVTEVFYDAFNKLCVREAGREDEDPMGILHEFGRLSKAAEHRGGSATYEPDKAPLRQRLW